MTGGDDETGDRTMTRPVAMTKLAATTRPVATTRRVVAMTKLAATMRPVAPKSVLLLMLFKTMPSSS